jgi:hypothetical protein
MSDVAVLPGELTSAEKVAGLHGDVRIAVAAITGVEVVADARAVR